MTAVPHSTPPAAPSPRGLARALIVVAFLGAVIGGVGAPLITSVAIDLRVSLDAAQWTLTITLFAGAIGAPVLGRLGAGPRRRSTLLATLVLVAVGGLLTAIPLPLGALLVGRALQGLGLGAIALLMSVARDRLPPDRAHATIATISVAGTVGIGVAYPLMGLVDEVAGLHAAYALGFVISLAAVPLAWHAVPKDPPGPRVGLDVAGAVLLGVGTLGVLLAVAQPSTWAAPWVGASVLVVAAAALAAWVVVERRSVAPLVDVRLLAHSGMLRANAAILTSGIAMYLLFALLTRYVQTPVAAGYGFGLSGVLAGAALIPFSVLGFVAGTASPWLVARVSTRWAFVVFAGFVVLATTVFVAAPGSLPVVLAAMAALGFGVGGVSAIMPRLVLAGMPSVETASVLSINQIVRSVGFSIGSALAGLLLATATPADRLAPSAAGYATAALWAVPLTLLAMVVLGRADRRREPPVSA